MASQFGDVAFQESLLRKNISEMFNVVDGQKLIRALDVAKSSHHGQKRDEGEDYVIHPIRVANTLVGAVGIGDVDVIVAALLHDVVEDTEVTLIEIGEIFGVIVAHYVSLLTRDAHMETKEEKFKKTLCRSQEVKLIKTSDWLDNLRSFRGRVDRGDRWQRHLREAQEMYIPLAQSTHNSYLIDEMIKAFEVAQGL
ncbi:MAG: HD domain-containing protein [bacterium]|nr:HD domain-containing protein [bacterium]